MIRTCVVIFAVLAVIAARRTSFDAAWGNNTSNYTEPYPKPTNYTDRPWPYPTDYPTSEPSPLDDLKQAFGKLMYKAEALYYNAMYRAQDEAVDFAGEVEESVVERVAGLADILDEISDEHLEY